MKETVKDDDGYGLSDRTAAHKLDTLLEGWGCCFPSHMARGTPSSVCVSP
jgi:hypothetical protein